MLSRVAENIYWMSRYIERAEDVARIVTVNANLLLDLPKGIAPGWEPLIVITGSNEPYFKRHKECGERSALRFLIGDADNTGSILSSLRAARENCRTIRDIVPREAWEQINELYLFARDNVQEGITKRGRHAFLRRIVLGSQTIHGLLSGTMNHDEGYQFLRIGRNLERADMTTRIIDVRSANLLPDDAPELRPFDNIQWMSVLKSLTAYQMYRRTMQARIRRGDVLRFLLQSEEFPRAFHYCVAAVSRCVDDLPNNEASLRVIGRLNRTVIGTRVEGLDQHSLHEFIDELQLGLADLHAEVAKAWFLPEPEIAKAS
jgi:uncharacterized alpha-E superfamily protein